MFFVTLQSKSVLSSYTTGSTAELKIKNTGLNLILLTRLAL